MDASNGGYDSEWRKKRGSDQPLETRVGEHELRAEYSYGY